jgi:5-methylcytosine-specific restriction endonuclease McrA
VLINVVSRSGKPLAPTRRPGRVRRLLKEGRARILCYEPFTIQLLYETTEYVPVEATVGVDPGATVTSAAAEHHRPDSDACEIAYAKEILMRTDVSAQVGRRAAARRSRRNRKTRHRKPRFHNRPKSRCSICGKNRTPKLWKKVKRKNGNSCKWVSTGRASVCRKCLHERKGEKGEHDAEIVLNPTLRNRTETVVREVEKLLKVMPVRKVRVEMAAFDTQKMANPEIQGAEYQHGTLFGYEVKEYLLLRYGRRCVYCKGRSGDPVLEVDHVIPKRRGGSDRVSNLVIACRTCNLDKGSRTAGEYGFPEVEKEAARFRAFRHSALAQSYKWALWRELSELCRRYGAELEATFGYRTKARRLELGLPKAQVVDAMVIAARGRGFSLPAEYLVERRLKARLPFHRFSNENKKGRTCVRTPADRDVFGFRLWDRVSFAGESGERAVGYITGLRERGQFEVSDLEGRVLAERSWRKLVLEARRRGNSWVERRPLARVLAAGAEPGCGEGAPPRA